MAESADENLDRFQSEGHSAFIVGYTGEVGKVLVKHLAQRKAFKKVLLIGRREVQLDSDVGPEFEQKVVDFDNLDNSADIFQGVGVGFCCLGTTRGKSGVDGFLKVDHDYVLKTAEVSKAAGCRHFSVMSSEGADKNSSILYARTKGQVEDALKAMLFDRLSVYRPGVLMCDREESRPGESFIRTVMKPMAYLFPTAVTIPVEVVAKGMTNNAMAKTDRTFELYDNKAIHQLAGNVKRCKFSSSNRGDSSKEK